MSYGGGIVVSILPSTLVIWVRISLATKFFLLFLEEMKIIDKEVGVGLFKKMVIKRQVASD